MEFNSLSFILFFPLFTVIFYLIPQKMKPLWIFLMSCFFYMCWNYKYIVLLLLVLGITYLAAVLIDRADDKTVKKGFLIGCIVSCISVLFTFKYFNMFSDTTASLVGMLGIHFQPARLDLVLPVGISFYIFQTLSYVIDVYRGNTKVEKNIVNYGAFVTFFPQLVAGPIERSNNLLAQIKQKHTLEPDKCIRGFGRMLWGYFQKVVLADRIAVLVTSIYTDYEAYSGVYIVLATVLFAFQIYCDFDGYTSIAIGAAEILGFRLMENFNAPYMAKSVAEFWRRWHISLSTWFRDYLYIPLGGNRCGIVKKYRNLLVTFLVSGLWHGANWTYVVWGGLHGIYQIIENMIYTRFHISREGGSKVSRFVKWVVTFVLVDFAWLFFRADSMRTAIGMIGAVFTNLKPTDILNREMAISMGLGMENMLVMALAMVVLFVRDFFKDKIRYGDVLVRMPILCRWGLLYIVMFVILIFGYYGPQYDAAQFIYFQF